jgi:chromate reductase
MTIYQIAVIVGSLRKDSFNRQLTVAIENLAPPEFKFKHVEIGDLPLYSRDEEKIPSVSVKRLKSGLRAAQGLLVATPEYNRSVPGVLKNEIDHGSRPHGDSARAGTPAVFSIMRSVTFVLL